MISSMSEPASRFSNTVATGIRVPLKTHAPLRFPGMLSTAGHCDQSRVAMFLPSFHDPLFLSHFDGGVTRGMFVYAVKHRREAYESNCQTPQAEPSYRPSATFRAPAPPPEDRRVGGSARPECRDRTQLA